MTIEVATAQTEIRQLVAQFTDAANRGDYDLFRSVWMADCVWEFRPPMRMVANGRDAVVESLRKLLEPREFFVHLVQDGLMVIDGNRAKARWYIQEMARNKDGKTFYRNVGLYQDELVKVYERWHFSRRTYHYIWLSTEPFGGDGFALNLSPASAV